MQSIVIYGIPNCDTVKKARTWLADHQIEFTFHDFKKSGLVRSTVESWLKHVPLDVLINRKGTTWRAFSDAQKAAAAERETAIDLLLASPSVIKRPVLAITSGQTTTVNVGFSAADYKTLFL